MPVGRDQQAFKGGLHMTTVTNGDLISIHYRGTLDDGTEFDNSYTRNQTIDFVVGNGQMIKGFELAVYGMEEGDKKSVTIEPENAYGNINPEAIKVFPRTSFPQDMPIEIGGTVEARTEDGRSHPARIANVKDDGIAVDFNHPLAGKTLSFDIELVKIQNQQIQNQQ